MGKARSRFSESNRPKPRDQHGDIAWVGFFRSGGERDPVVSGLEDEFARVSAERLSRFHVACPKLQTVQCVGRDALAPREVFRQCQGLGVDLEPGRKDWPGLVDFRQRAEVVQTELDGHPGA